VHLVYFFSENLQLPSKSVHGHLNGGDAMFCTAILSNNHTLPSYTSCATLTIDCSDDPSVFFAGDGIC